MSRGRPGDIKRNSRVIESPAEDELPPVASRLGDIGFAIGALLVGGGILFVLGSRLWMDVREVLVFDRVAGAVTKQTAVDPAAEGDAEHGQIFYTYRVDNQGFDGVYPPPERIDVPNVEFVLLRNAWLAGQAIDVFFDPSDPATSTLEPRVEPAPLFFLTFVVPFFVLSVTMLRRRARSSRASGDVLFLSYFILSGLGSFGGLALSMQLPWQAGCVLGLLMPTAIVPATVRAIDRWTERGAIRERNELVGVALAAIFWWSVVGIFVGGVAYHFVSTITARSQFVAGQATVVRSVLRTDHGGKRTTYEPIVVYRYEVAGVAYENDRIRYAPWNTGDKEWAEAELLPYPVHAKVRVYFDPQNPGESLLKRNYETWDWIMVAILAPFVAVGILFIVLCVKAARKCRHETAIRRRATL